MASKTTTDHDEVRQWADARGAVPAAVESTGDQPHHEPDAGLLRFEFRDNASLDEVDWEPFFRTFEDRKLAFLYQDETGHGEGERAHRTAYSAVKQKFEKVGDHWERKGGGRSAASDAGGRGNLSDTHGGVDTKAPKRELYDIAKRLDISGRSKMDKGQLVRAIEKENGRRTRSARN